MLTIIRSLKESTILQKASRSMNTKWTESIDPTIKENSTDRLVTIGASKKIIATPILDSENLRIAILSTENAELTRLN